MCGTVDKEISASKHWELLIDVMVNYKNVEFKVYFSSGVCTLFNASFYATVIT